MKRLAACALITIGAMAATTVPAMAASSQICGSGWPYQVSNLMVYGVPYSIVTGNFGGHYECLALTAGRPAFQVTKSFWLSRFGNVQAYPNIGTTYHLPTHIWGLSPKVTWSYKTNSAPGAWNASIEMWINRTPTVVGHPNGAEIMVWMDKHGPSNFAPSKGFPVVTVNGTQWYVLAWHPHIIVNGKTISWNYAQFRRVHLLAYANIKTMPIAPFYWAAEKRGLLDSHWYLETVQGGNEIWNGGQGLQTTWFRVTGLPATATYAPSSITHWVSGS